MHVNDFYTKYFAFMLRAFPDVVHLHFGLANSAPRSLFGLPSRVKTGSQALLEDLISFSGLGIPKSMHGLDLGCGLGGTSVFLSGKYGHHMTGLTITAAQISVAAQNVRKQHLKGSVRVLRGDGTTLCFNDSTFDFVIMIEVAMHVENKAALFREVSRVLKPNGRLVMADVEVCTPDPLMVCFGVHSFPMVFGYRDLGKSTGFHEYQELDVSWKVALWMKDYVLTSSLAFQIATVISLIAKARLGSAMYFVKSQLFLRRHLLENIERYGLQPERGPRLRSSRDVREQFKGFLEKGAMIYKFSQQRKTQSDNTQRVR